MSDLVQAETIRTGGYVSLLLRKRFWKSTWREEALNRTKNDNDKINNNNNCDEYIG